MFHLTFVKSNCSDIKERDTITGKVKYSWSIASVLSCVLGRGETTTVDIIFDTKRKDKENRRYFIELEDAKVCIPSLKGPIVLLTINSPFCGILIFLLVMVFPSHPPNRK